MRTSIAANQAIGRQADRSYDGPSARIVGDHVTHRPVRDHERINLRYRKSTLDLLKDPAGPLAGPFCTGETDRHQSGATGLRIALAACREGDSLVVAKLDRLARSLRDASDIVDELTAKGVKLNIGGSIHGPLDPVGRLLFNVLAMVAEFEPDLIRSRTRGDAGRQSQGQVAGEATRAVGPATTSPDGTAHGRPTRHR